jgi:hypothetical protein
MSSHRGSTFVRRLLGGTALVGAAAAGTLFATPAFAQNECGATTEGTVTCPASGNPYPNGITYFTPPVNPAEDPGLDPTVLVYDLTVNLGDGVAIASGANPGVAIIGFNDGSATLNSFGNTSITVAGTGATGVIGLTNAGDLTINTDSITTSGRASAGIIGNAATGDVTINSGTMTIVGDGSVGISANSFAGNVAITAGTINVDGYYATGIAAYSAYGDITIDAGTVTTTAAGSFYNFPSTAIDATNIYGTIDIAADTVSTTADYSDGINAISFYGDSVVVNAGTISTAGYASNGALLQAAGDTTLTVDSIATTGDNSYGAIALTTAGGTATIISTGSITTTGDTAYGAVAVAINGGDANVTVNDVATSGDFSPAIYADGDNVTVTVNGAVSTAGFGSRGIDAFAGDGVATIINNGSITTTGDSSIGIAATGIYGAVVSGAGSVSTSGDNSSALLVRALYGDVDVTVGDVTTTGDNAPGITAISYFGNASVTSSGTISTTGVGSTGVYAGSAAGLGDAAVTVNNVATAGQNANAIAVYGYNAAATINGAVSTTGDFSNAVSVFAIGDTASVTNNGSITATGLDSAGIVATAYGDVTISGVGSVSSSGTGIDAYSRDGDIVIAQGDIATTQDDADGITAYAYNLSYTGGNITIDVGAVDTLGDNADGIDAQAPYGGTIDITHGAITTAGDLSFGVIATGNDGISVTGESITTTGYNAAGVYAVSLFGDVAIDQGTVSTAGRYAPGIVGASYFGNVSITADNVTTTGDDSKGVYGIAIFDGDTDVTVGNVTTSGQYSIGVDAQAYGDAAVTVTGTVATSGYAAEGVNVYGIYNASLTNTGTIRTSGAESDGIHIESVFGDVVVAGTGTVATTGDFSTGIFARSYQGTIDITAGTVTTGRAAGIDAYASRGVSVTAGTVRTTGDGANAVNAGGFYSVDVTVGTISTTGANANGIAAVSFGGDLDINAGSVLVTGAGSTAIRAFGFGGGTDVAVTGAVRSTQATAIDIIAAGAGGAGGPATGNPALDGIARLTVAAGGSVQGGTNAVTSNALNATQITNNGSITGGTGYAIQATGGAATIVNNGSLTGRLLLTANADRLTNTGTFTLIGSSDFGVGSDALVNSGTVRLAAAAATQAVALSGLETFSNSGLVDLRNARAGDALTIGGYIGGGAATLGLDLSYGATTATVDRLNVTSATGSTQVVLAPLSGTPILIPSTTIVQASTTSSPGAFTISAGSRYNGLIEYGVIYNPTAFAYQLVSAPNATVYRQVKLAEGLASVWNRSGDAVTAHLTAARDTGWGNPAADSSGRLWLQMFGEVNKRSRDYRSFAFNGLSQRIDSSYKQDAFGGQIGFDLVGATSDTGGFTVGLSGGYLTSAMTFAGNDRFEIDAVNAAVYGAFQSGGFFLNGLAKYDHAWIAARGNAPQVNFDLDTKANTWGAKLEGGFRAGSDKLFFESAVSVAYTRTDLDGYRVLGGSFDFDKYTGLRSKAGARVGGSTPLGASSTLVFYAGGAAVHEFEGEGRLNFTSGAQTIALRNDRLGTYAQGTLGLNIITAGGISGFVEGHADYSNSYTGGGGRAGIRIKF